MISHLLHGTWPLLGMSMNDFQSLMSLVIIHWWLRQPCFGVLGQWPKPNLQLVKSNLPPTLGWARECIDEWMKVWLPKKTSTNIALHCFHIVSLSVNKEILNPPHTHNSTLDTKHTLYPKQISRKSALAIIVIKPWTTHSQEYLLQINGFVNYCVPILPTRQRKTKWIWTWGVGE